METATATHRTPSEIRKEIREHLKNIKNFVKAVAEGTPEHAKYKALKKELSEAEQYIKQNNMFLFIEAQNLINRQLNKITPEAQNRIKSILGKKFLNMDSSRNHKHVNLFKGLEGTTTKETKKYKYRINVTFETRYFLHLDISIHIWNENGKFDYSDNQILCSFENGTSLKEITEFTEFKTYTVKTELKKLQKYEEQKKKLAALKAPLNSEFMKVFCFYFEKDNY